MDCVSNPANSVLYGKYPLADCDPEENIFHPQGLESFVIEMPYSATPVVIPVQLAITWQEDLIENLDNQMMVEGDYLLVTAPKAGTHWMWEIMGMLVKGEAVYSSEPKHQMWTESTPYNQIVCKRQTTPRVINTHLTLSQLPPTFRERDTKTVVCMRNPKDVFVSLYYHFRNAAAKIDGEFISFADMFDVMLRSKYVPFGKTLDHYADIWDNYRYDPNVLIVFYEDLKEHTFDTIRLIAEHMAVDYTNELISNITAAVDITSMRRGKYCSESGFRKRYGQEATLYRKGEIGDWKNHFTSEQNEEFDKVYTEWNKFRNVPFRFEPSHIL